MASRLGALLQPLRGRCHVNIIPLNPTGGFAGKPANTKALTAFIDVLGSRRYGITATARVQFLGFECVLGLICVFRRT